AREATSLPCGCRAPRTRIRVRGLGRCPAGRQSAVTHRLHQPAATDRHLPMPLRLALLALLALGAPAAAVSGQSPAERITAGDRAHEARDPDVALMHYEAALAADSANYEALWRASRDAADLGQAAP